MLAALAVLVPAVLPSQAIPARKAPGPGRAVLYAAVGAELTQYDLDREHGALIRRGSVTVPANVQEAWLHPSQKYLYVAWSNNTASYSPSVAAASKGDQHGVTAFRIDPASGALVLHGKPASLPSRPVFITTDMDGTHVISAHNDPSGLTVHRILPDGTLGAQVQQPAGLDFGIYGHQVRTDPSNRTVILVTRGNAPTAAKAEDPGALKIFSYKNGVLANRLSIAPGGGFGYQVRHVDFHPSGKWAFVTLERQNQIHVYRRMPDGTLGTTPLFVKETVPESAKRQGGMAPSTIHVHPNGKVLYAAIRGGESTIAVFSINQDTGEPILIQNMDTQGAQPRTFSLDSSGSFLVVANQSPRSVNGPSGATTVPASLVLFRIRNDGKLEFLQKYNTDADGSRSLFWAGFASLP